MKILVKKKHIKDGRRGEFTDCPVALALQECGLRKAGVTQDWITWLENKKWKRISTPQLVKLKVHRYDGLGQMTSFEFDLGD